MFGTAAAFGIYWNVQKDPLPGQAQGGRPGDEEPLLFRRDFTTVCSSPLHDMVARLVRLV
jgi:hypothetical protein